MRHGCGFWTAAAVMALVVMSGGCFDSNDAGAGLFNIPGSPDVIEPVVGLGIGEACTNAEECRNGLACNDAGACEAAGQTAEGSPCAVSAECQDGLACSLAGVCAPAGKVEENGSCSSGLDCQAGLTCAAIGLSGVCQPEGTGDLGAGCESGTDCLSGLICRSDTGECTHPALALTELFTTLECVEETGPARAYFEVPRGGEPDGEFYKLPFPNDLRRTGSRLDLSGHPTAPLTPLGFDPVARLIDHIETSVAGFSPNAPVLFQLSASVQGDTLDSLTFNGGNPDTDTVAIVDIDPASPTYGSRVGLSWQTRSGPESHYLCQHWLALIPSWSRPLRPGTTYAAVILDGLLDDNNAFVQRDADFETVMSDAAPDDTDLNGAWETYAPLRAFCDDDSVEHPIERDRVIVAAVFTTVDPTEKLVALRQASADAPAPEAADLTLCSAGVDSPCALEGDAHAHRACDAESASFYEIHGRVILPIYQAGTAPYLAPEDGGGIATPPVVERTESTCFSLTVPKGVPMPDEGYAVALYAHGTNGSFRSAVLNGFAESVSAVTTEAGSTGLAVLSIDQVQHADRRGGSELDPETLFFNVGNPAAAEGNALQGAADHFQLERLVETIDFGADSSPTGQALRLDPTRIYFVGHSQGATVGVPYAAVSERVKVSVFSGAGGGLAQSVFDKKSPVDVSAALPFALADRASDGSLPGGLAHPALGLLQHAFAAVDPLSYALHLYREPLSTDRDALGTHILHVWGLGDTYTPDSTATALAGASFLRAVTPVLQKFTSAEPLEPPVTLEPGPVTAVAAQYGGVDGNDAHFVLFDNEDARAQAAGFLGSAALDPQNVPTLVAP